LRANVGMSGGATCEWRLRRFAGEYAAPSHCYRAERSGARWQWDGAGTAHPDVDQAERSGA